MWGITDYALASLGAVSVPIYPTLPPDKIAYTIKNAHVRAIVIEDEEQWDKVLDSKAILDYKIMMYPGKAYEDQKQSGDLTFTELEEIGEQNKLADVEKRCRQLTRSEEHTSEL